MATRIDIQQLRMADIIVSTGNAAVSKAIRASIGADVSHASLYAGNNTVIEAVSEGVVERSWPESSHDMTLAIALRRRNMTDDLRKKVVSHAKFFANEKRPYDKIGAVGSGMFKKRGSAITSGLILGGCVLFPELIPVFQSADALAKAAIANNASSANKDNAFFCSELVCRAYQLAGVPLSDLEPSYVNPREVRMSTRLFYLGHLIGG